MTVVDGYELGRELARGGMGVVHEAVEVASGRRVALKRMLTAFAGDPEAVARFMIEAQAAARLRHPGVVTVHAAGRASGAPYLVMELVEGESLQRRLDRAGPLAPEEALSLVEALADALAHAHAAGVLHRDLKPSNVLVDATGQPRLTDFGLARLLDASTRERLTRTGEWVGTPAFMAPEQAVGSKVTDERTDVYGLGATLFAALTARPPFEGTSAIAIAHAVLTRSPRAPSSLRPGLPPAIDALVLRCLAKDPAARPASMSELRRAIEAARRGEGVARRAAPWLLLAGGGAAALAVVAWAAAEPAPAAPRAPTPPPAAPTEPPPPAPAPEQPQVEAPPPAPAPLTPDELHRLRVRLLNPELRASLTDEQVEQLAANDADNAMALLLRANRRAARGEVDAALDDCERVIELARDHGGNVSESAHRMRWLLLRRVDRLADARAALDQGIEEHPDDADLRWDRAILHAASDDRRDKELAIADFEHLIALGPERRIDAARMLGQLLRDLGRPTEVEPRLRSLVTEHRDPALVEVYVEALTFEPPDPQRLRDALAFLDEAMASGARSARSLRARARVRAWSNDPGGALQDRLDAVALEPDDPMARIELAESLIAGGHLGRALTQIDSAVAAGSGRADVLSFAVMLLRSAGERRRALEVAERWLEASPGNSRVVTIIEELRAELR